MQPFDYTAYTQVLHTLPHPPRILRVGLSRFGRGLYLVRVGTDRPQGLIHGAIHAREHITAHVVYALMQEYAAQYRPGMPTVDFLPMVNPDGVELALHGLSTVPPVHRAYLAAISRGSPFSLWKANGIGVDLNVNFDADWGSGKQNLRTAGAENYIGPHPHSEPESRALVRLTQTYRYRWSLSYHAKGSVVYYGYGEGAHAHQGQRLALLVADHLGYTASQSVGSAGGYKDWHTHLDSAVSALTVEVGKEEYPHPYPMEDLPRILAENKGIVQLVANEWKER